MAGGSLPSDLLRELESRDFAPARPAPVLCGKATPNYATGDSGELARCARARGHVGRCEGDGLDWHADEAPRRARAWPPVASLDAPVPALPPLLVEANSLRAELAQILIDARDAGEKGGALGDLQVAVERGYMRAALRSLIRRLGGAQ